MGKTLADIAVSLKEIQSRGDDFLSTMGKLNDAFYNPTTGVWGLYCEGLDMLSELADKEKADGNKRVSGWDGSEQAAYIRSIDEAKKRCVKISKEYWLTVKRVQGVRNEVIALKTKCDAAIAKKAKKIKKSDSIDELRALSNKLDNYKDNIALACMGGPHKPDHKLLA